MLSLSRSKALVVFLIFAGLVLAGLGALATQDPDDRIAETPDSNSSQEEPDAGSTGAVVSGEGARKDSGSEDDTAG